MTQPKSTEWLSTNPNPKGGDKDNSTKSHEERDPEPLPQDTRKRTEILDSETLFIKQKGQIPVACYPAQPVMYSNIRPIIVTRKS